MDTAVVILAGGKSRRMGRDKLELQIEGKTLLESAVSRFKEEFGDVYVSVADAEKYPGVTANKIVDILPGAGPLSGLHAALTSIECDGVFLVAADLPYAPACAAKRIIELCRDNDACIIRLPDGRLEPLFGYYRKALLPLCEEAIRSGNYQIREILFGANTLFIEPHDLGALWNEQILLNVNYPEDYEKLQK